LRETAGSIVAGDISPKAVETARRNADTAGVANLLQFHVCDFAGTPMPEGGGVVVLNPEYGERTGQVEELEATYRRIGDFFKQKCAGRTGFVFTGNLGLAGKVGLRSNRRLTFFNGPIECRLLRYDLYTGSRRKPVPEPRTEECPPRQGC
jgi:putative N6-adenine-specific DNA methylase